MTESSRSFAAAGESAVGAFSTVNDWLLSFEGRYLLSPAKLAVIWYGLADVLSVGVTVHVATPIVLPVVPVVPEQLSAPNPIVTDSPPSGLPAAVSFALSVTGVP